MSLDTRTIEPGQVGTAPLTYALKDSEAFSPQTISATFDGAAAAGPFLPCVTFLAQDGKVIARCPADVALGIGDVAEVTYAPFLRGAAASSSGSGIQFDTVNTGGWLNVTTTSFNPGDSRAIYLHATGDGDDVVIDSEGGVFVNDVNGYGVTFLLTNGTGGAADFTVTAGEDFVVSAGRDVDMHATNFMNLDAADTVDITANGAAANAFQITAGSGGLVINVGAGKHVFVAGTGSLFVLDSSILPLVNPGVPGALWNNGGVVNVS